MVGAMLAAVALWFGPGTEIVAHAPWKIRPKQQVVIVEKSLSTPLGTIREDGVFLVWRTRFWQGCPDPFKFEGVRYCWMGRSWGSRLTTSPP